MNSPRSSRGYKRVMRFGVPLSLQHLEESIGVTADLNIPIVELYGVDQVFHPSVKALPLNDDCFAYLCGFLSVREIFALTNTCRAHRELLLAPEAFFIWRKAMARYNNRDGLQPWRMRTWASYVSVHGNPIPSAPHLWALMYFRDKFGEDPSVILSYMLCCLDAQTETAEILARFMSVCWNRGFVRIMTTHIQKLHKLRSMLAAGGGEVILAKNYPSYDKRHVLRKYMDSEECVEKWKRTQLCRIIIERGRLVLKHHRGASTKSFLDLLTCLQVQRRYLRQQLQMYATSEGYAYAFGAATVTNNTGGSKNKEEEEEEEEKQKKKGIQLPSKLKDCFETYTKYLKQLVRFMHAHVVAKTDAEWFPNPPFRNPTNASGTGQVKAHHTGRPSYRLQFVRRLLNGIANYNCKKGEKRVDFEESIFNKITFTDA